MNRIFFTLLFFILSSVLFAQTSTQNSAERRKLIREIDRKVEESIVLEFLRKCNERLKKSIKDNKPLLPVEYSSLAAPLDIWLKYRWLVADTGLSKSWLKDIHDQLVYIGKMRRFLREASGDTNSKAKIEKAKEYINISHERLFALMKKVVKAPLEVRRANLKEKDAWQKAMRKKYNIKKEDTWNSF